MPPLHPSTLQQRAFATGPLPLDAVRQRPTGRLRPCVRSTARLQHRRHALGDSPYAAVEPPQIHCCPLILSALYAILLLTSSKTHSALT